MRRWGEGVMERGSEEVGRGSEEVGRGSDGERV